MFHNFITKYLPYLSSHNFTASVIGFPNFWKKYNCVP